MVHKLLAFLTFGFVVAFLVWGTPLWIPLFFVAVDMLLRAFGA